MIGILPKYLSHVNNVCGACREMCVWLGKFVLGIRVLFVANNGGDIGQ